jgi:hypothetical protein
MTKQYPQQHWKVLQIQELSKVLHTLFLLPHFKQNTHKKTNTHWDKTCSQHIAPNLGLQASLLKVKKEKTNLLKHYLPTYLLFYFVICYSEIRIPPEQSLCFRQQKSDQTLCLSPHHQSCYDNYDDETNPHLSSLPFALYHCRSDLQIPYGSGFCCCLITLAQKSCSLALLYF